MTKELAAKLLESKNVFLTEQGRAMLEGMVSEVASPKKEAASRA